MNVFLTQVTGFIGNVVAEKLQLAIRHAIGLSGQKVALDLPALGEALRMPPMAYH